MPDETYDLHVRVTMNTVLLPLRRDVAERLYDYIGETPHGDEWSWPIHVALADALGYHVPEWVREKAERVASHG